jgi:3-deoxy-manno-octulosonate cytidylyltransferase (CMP-KDO synthetase)
MARVFGIIPARYASTRLPGKALCDIAGKPMISWVYEACIKSGLFEELVVATDDHRIQAHMQQMHGAESVQMTSSTHNTGTDRCAEILTRLDADPADVIINIQGDEPFVATDQLQSLIKCFDSQEVEIATLALWSKDEEEYLDPNCPKLVQDHQGRALYFSRSPIPFHRSAEFSGFWRHLGVYAFRSYVLKQLSELKASKLELAESLEQLRWLENGYYIQVAEVSSAGITVDTPEDLEAAQSYAASILS